MKLTIYSITLVYLLFMAGCVKQKASKNSENAATHAAHEGHNHSDEHAHDHDEHDHNHEGHSHETEDNHHDHDGHDHSGENAHDHEDHKHDHEGHSHEAEDNHHDHEGLDHAGEDAHNHDEHDHSSHEGHGHSHDIVESHGQLHDEDHQIITVRPQEFSNIIKTSGELLPAKGDEVVVNALHNGIVRFRNKQLFGGKAVKSKESILFVSGNKMTNDNLHVGYVKAKAEYEQGKKELDRATKLKKDTIISEKEFLAIKSNFETVKVAFNAIRKNYDRGGQRVIAPCSGFIKSVMVTDGQFVEAGTPLLIISKNQRLILKAEVSQKYISVLPKVGCATFKPSYSKEVFDTHELNGSVISYGKTTAQNSFYTPLFFEIDKTSELIPGSYTEVYLRVHTHGKTMVLPKTALLEDQGTYYVFVKKGAEFEKSYVKLGGTDGKNVQILSGISTGDRVATKEVYRIKLSKTGSAIPHGHSH